MDNIQENEFENIDELDEISDEELLEDEASVETKDDSQLNLSSSENDGNDSSNFQNILQTEPITQIQEVVPSYEPLPNEIGKVKNIGTENINIMVTSKQALEKNLIDHHVIFNTNDNKKIVGTLISLDSNEGKVKLIG